MFNSKAGNQVNDQIEFQNYIGKYGKSYSSKEGYRERFDAFKTAQSQIRVHNFLQEGKPVGRRVILGCNGMTDNTETESDLLMCFRNPPDMGHLYKDSSDDGVKIWKHTSNWDTRFNQMLDAYSEYGNSTQQKENKDSDVIVDDCDSRATLDWRCRIHIQRPQKQLVFCGSCWAHAAASSLEAFFFMRDYQTKQNWDR